MNQKGGLIGKAVESVAPSAKEVKDYKDAAKTAGVHDDWNLSSADKLQIASIAGDVASLVASLPTAGGNPVAAGLGVGSTLAQFGADVKRDGFQGSDVLWLLGGLGLDAITVLPFVGAAGKAAKLAKMTAKIKPVADIVKGALLAGGSMTAVSGLTNIVNGNATLDDWKKLSIGLLSIKGVGDTIKKNKAIKQLTDTPEVARSNKKIMDNDAYDSLLNTKDRKTIVDKILKDKSELMNYNGKPTN